MAYSYLLVVEDNKDAQAQRMDGKDVSKATHKFDSAQHLQLPHRSLLGSSFLQLSLFLLQQLLLITPSASFTHSGLFLGSDSFTLQGELSGN